MQTVLISGAYGFLGKIIYQSFEKKNIQVDTIDLDKRATFVYNISNDIPFFDSNYQMVIHAAGLAHILPRNKEEEKLFFDINFQGTVNLCSAMEKNLPNTFVFISTIAVYGKETGCDIKESHPLEGNTPYAKSKIMAEAFLEEWCFKKKVNLVILRLPLVAGENAKGNLGAMVNGIKKGYYFNIKGSRAKKSIVLTEDVANLIPELIKKNGIYNLSGDKDYTFKEISEVIAQQMGKKSVLSLPFKLVKAFAKLGDMIKLGPLNSETLKKIANDLTVSSEKAKKELNWNPRSLKNYKI